MKQNRHRKPKHRAKTEMVILYFTIKQKRTASVGVLKASMKLPSASWHSYPLNFLSNFLRHARYMDMAEFAASIFLSCNILVLRNPLCSILFPHIVLSHIQFGKSHRIMMSCTDWDVDHFNFTENQLSGIHMIGICFRPEKEITNSLNFLAKADQLDWSVMSTPPC